MDLGKGLKHLRERKKVTQVELCTLTGLSQTTISQIESQKKWPSRNTIKKISDALGVTEDTWFLFSLERDKLNTTTDINHLKNKYSYGSLHDNKRSRR